MKKLFTRKGVTLMELSIVLALLSIFLLMVTSFTILANNQTEVIQNQENIIADYNSMKEVFDTWVSYFDSDEYLMYVSTTDTTDDTLCIYKKTDTSEIYKLCMQDGILVGETPEGATDPYVLSGTVLRVSFFITSDSYSTTTKSIIRFNFTYEKYLYRAQTIKTKEQTATFYKTPKALLYGGEPS